MQGNWSKRYLTVGQWLAFLVVRQLQPKNEPLESLTKVAEFLAIHRQGCCRPVDTSRAWPKLSSTGRSSTCSAAVAASEEVARKCFRRLGSPFPDLTTGSRFGPPTELPKWWLDRCCFCRPQTPPRRRCWGHIRSTGISRVITFTNSSINSPKTMNPRLLRRWPGFDSHCSKSNKKGPAIVFSPSRGRWHKWKNISPIENWVNSKFSSRNKYYCLCHLWVKIDGGKWAVEKNNEHRNVDTSFRSIIEVNQRWPWIVLGWDTPIKLKVLLAWVWILSLLKGAWTLYYSNPGNYFADIVTAWEVLKVQPLKSSLRSNHRKLG